MLRTRLTLAAIAALSTLPQAISVHADANAAPPAAKAAVAPGSSDARIEGLLALPPAERRARLKQMKPSERRGLWFELKKVQAQRRGAAGSGRGAYRGAGRRVAGKPARATSAVATIQYDSGTFSTSFGGGAIVGNRFNTHTGAPILQTGTVSTVEAVVVPGASQTSSSAGFVLLGPETASGGAQAIFSTFTAASGATDTIAFQNIDANFNGPSFLVLFGDFANSYVPVFGTGTRLGQGFHGAVGYTGGMGPNITNILDLPLNSFVRATGNNLPVELMTFEVG